MIDPRFAKAGAIPLMSGFGAQQMPLQYHHYHHHRHHRHHRQKLRNDESPVSRDESIHKVDHAQHNFAQNNEMLIGNGYGLPYSTNSLGAQNTSGFYQQQQYNGNNIGYTSQYQNTSNVEDAFVGAPLEQTVTTHRHHHRHHRHHTVEAENTGNDGQEHLAPEQLIGQRSSSVVSNQGEQTRSPAPLAEGEDSAGHGTQRRHRRHHRGGEHAKIRQTHQSRRAQGHTSVGADGYGHINSDLIFIERGDQSPHRQDAPSGYEYKGKIEVQGIDREYRSRSHGSGSRVAQPVTIPQSGVPPVQIPQSNVPTSNFGPCPPGWQQMALSAVSGVLRPPGAFSYSGQTMGAFGVTPAGFGSFGTVGSFGLPGFGGGFSNFGAGLSFPPPCQYMADSGFGLNTGATTTTGGTLTGTGYQQPTGNLLTEQHHHQSEQVEEHVSDRPTIIEVWQRRSKSEKRSDSSSPTRFSTQHHHHHHRQAHQSQTPKEGPSFDFERFRSELLHAIERMVPRSGPGTVDVQPSKGDGGTQTQLRPSMDEPRIKSERRHETTSGEVRVIVQPVQPVFYMPRQAGSTTTTTTTTEGIPQIGPVPVIQQQSSTGGSNVVYVPRNVYVPVIKPVFVPRERVIVRPQVIHVARPVLVDRPVPVTQRPIIIDRERPVAVPIRGSSQGTAQTTDAKVAQEDYVYRDNLPVAYGGQFAEFTNNANYGYGHSQQEQQYSTGSTHETSNIYQTQIPCVGVNVSDQYQQSQSDSHFETQQGVGGSFHGSYTNLVGTDSSYNTGINNEYLAGQQVQTYITGSTHETGDVYQTEGSIANVNAPSKFQHNQSTSHFDLQQGSNLVCTNEDMVQNTFEQSSQATGISVGGSGQIEILDTAVNPFWQKTDSSNLVRRYGRPAFEIVHKSEEVEQRMYNELRQRESTSGIVRSSSTASYASGSGIGFNGSDMLQY